MALDGVTVAAIVHELAQKTVSGRVDKIYQPENDEIIIAIRCQGNNLKLLLSANPSHPRIHITEQAKQNPLSAPLFCMVLRKHLSGGKVLSVCQHEFERIIEIKVESLNEMGDASVKTLIVEIMGKHSNIILTNENGVILDSIKHISHEKSSVREVLPGGVYVLPPSKDKLNPLLRSKEQFQSLFKGKQGFKLIDVIYQSYSGISPFLAGEVCHRAKVDSTLFAEQATAEHVETLFKSFDEIMADVESGKFTPEIIFNEAGKPIEFSCVNMTLLEANERKSFENVSELLEVYYKTKDNIYRITQKSVDIRKIVQQNIERCIKKKELYDKTLKSISGRDTLRLYGELITANIYAVEKGTTSFTTVNFYDEDCKEITIRLDPTLTPSENAAKYFKKYNKEKRTFIALQDQIAQNDEELLYLETVLSTISTSADEQDIEEIREELAESGFVKKRRAQKGQKQKKSKPMHFVSSDGFDIYVGKNNKQNDELTLRFAEALDLWFHTKEIPGSHVIIKTNGETPPNQTLNEAANLAAFYSKAQNSSLVPVDYVIKKFVKKPNGARPGMVIYDNYKTAYVTPIEELINSMKKM